MGTIHHNAIIVSAFDEEKAKEIRQKAIEIMNKDYTKGKFTNKVNIVSEIMNSPINMDYNFCVFPDGSKEGWDMSTEFDKRRKELREYLHNNSCCYWVEVSYGELSDDIEDGSDTNESHVVDS